MSSDSPRDENARQYEVVNLMLSMHSLLRERYERRAFWLNTTQIGVSLFLSIFAFVSDDVLRSLGHDPRMARFVIGIAAVVVLLLSITEFRVDWRTVASGHGEAMKYLAALKAEYRREFSAGPNVESERLTRGYEETMARLVPIPETLFNRLKAIHEFKRALSKRLGEYPAAPRWFLRMQLRWEGVVAALGWGTTALSKEKELETDE